VNISLYTKTCKRKPEEAMRNMRNMKNPQAGALSCLLQVIQVFHVIHVIHVFQVFPMRACVAGGHAGGTGHPKFARFSWGFPRAGNSRRALGLFADSPKGAMTWQ
jgi:hypothetical protein